MNRIYEILVKIERQLDLNNRLMAYHVTHPPKHDEGYADIMRRDDDILSILTEKKEDANNA